MSAGVIYLVCLRHLCSKVDRTVRYVGGGGTCRRRPVLPSSRLELTRTWGWCGQPPWEREGEGPESEQRRERGNGRQGEREPRWKVPVMLPVPPKASRLGGGP